MQKTSTSQHLLHGVAQALRTAVMQHKHDGQTTISAAKAPLEGLPLDSASTSAEALRYNPLGCNAAYCVYADDQVSQLVCSQQAKDGHVSEAHHFSKLRCLLLVHSMSTLALSTHRTGTPQELACHMRQQGLCAHGVGKGRSVSAS